MKYLLIIGLYLLPFTLEAGTYTYYTANIDFYDPVTGFYYKSIVSKREKKSFLSSESDIDITNINIFSPDTNNNVLLFNDGKTHIIISMIFESAYKDGSIEFFGDTYANYIKNNQGLAERALKNKLLLEVHDLNEKTKSLWIAEKNGKNLTKLLTIPDNAHWHLDVKNSKIRVVKQVEGKLEINSYDW